MEHHILFRFFAFYACHFPFREGPGIAQAIHLFVVPDQRYGWVLACFMPSDLHGRGKKQRRSLLHIMIVDTVTEDTIYEIDVYEYQFVCFLACIPKVSVVTDFASYLISR